MKNMIMEQNYVKPLWYTTGINILLLQIKVINNYELFYGRPLIQ